MAVYRPVPKCNFCGEPIARGIYNKNSHKIGDNFIRWEYLNHSCSGMRKYWEDFHNQPEIKASLERFKEEFTKETGKSIENKKKSGLWCNILRVFRLK